jgi:hypothetical protein
LYRFDGYSLKEIQFGSKLNHVKSVKKITVSGDWLYLILGNLNLIRVHTSKFNFELLYTSSISKDGQIVDFELIDANTLILVNTKNSLIQFDLLRKTFKSKNVRNIIFPVIQSYRGTIQLLGLAQEVVEYTI